MKGAIQANPVTTVSAVTAIALILGRIYGWDVELQAAVAQLGIVIALAFRGFIAWWVRRNDAA